MTKSLPPHSVIRPLAVDDVDAIIEVSHKAFPPAQAASREKVLYRLKACPELCLGLFIRSYEPKDKTKGEENDSDDDQLPSATTTIVDEKLVAVILATKMRTGLVTKGSMEMPSGPDDEDNGHKEDGTTVGIHAVCVDPDYQRKSIGSILMNDYVQRISTNGVANRIALIATKDFAPFYENLGFDNEGVSDCKDPPGVTWYDLSIGLMYN